MVPPQAGLVAVPGCHHFVQDRRDVLVPPMASCFVACLHPSGCLLPSLAGCQHSRKVPLYSPTGFRGLITPPAHCSRTHCLTLSCFRCWHQCSVAVSTCRSRTVPPVPFRWRLLLYCRGWSPFSSKFFRIFLALGSNILPARESAQCTRGSRRLARVGTCRLCGTACPPNVPPHCEIYGA